MGFDRLDHIGNAVANVARNQRRIHRLDL